MKCKCKFCGRESDSDELILNEHDVPTYCPHCERSAWDMSRPALIYAERYGIYEYKVNGMWIEYWSFFSGEGFRFIRHHLLTGEENRDVLIPWTAQDDMPVPAFLRSENGGCLYNYNVG